MTTLTRTPPAVCLPTFRRNGLSRLRTATRGLALLLCSVLAAATVQAAPPATTVSWVAPSGTVRADASIDVWLRLTVDAGASTPLVLDGTSANFDLGAEFPEFATLTSVQSVSWLGCENTFIPGQCNEPDSAYVYAFNLGADSFNPYVSGQPVPLGITLQPGESRDFLVATFAPRHGQVPEGLYTLSNAGLQLSLRGLDVNGQPIERVFGLGSGCNGGPQCETFQRLVTTVPEPGTPLLMLAGVGWLAMRRWWRAGGTAGASA